MIETDCRYWTNGHTTLPFVHDLFSPFYHLPKSIHPVVFHLFDSAPIHDWVGKTLTTRTEHYFEVCRQRKRTAFHLRRRSPPRRPRPRGGCFRFIHSSDERVVRLTARQRQPPKGEPRGAEEGGRRGRLLFPLPSFFLSAASGLGGGGVACGVHECMYM